MAIRRIILNTEELGRAKIADERLDKALPEQEMENLGQSEPIVVRAPRKTIFDFILMIVTLSFYLPFWAIGRAKDMSAASDNTYRPWLWFFTPWLWIPGVIAYSSMFRDLGQMEGKRQRDKWAFWAVPWFVAFAALSIFFNLERRIQAPFWVYLFALIVFCGLFALVHRRFNLWKIQDSRLSFKGKRSGYAWYEWVILSIAAPFFCYLTYSYLWPTLKNFNVPTYVDMQEVTLDDLGASFTVKGNSWKPIAGGDADFEMMGPGYDTGVFIYSYADDQTFADVTASRFEVVGDSYKGVKCHETKRFEYRQSGTRSVMTCSGRYWGSYVELTSVVSELDDNLLEFVGVTASESLAHTKKVSEQIQGMAESFFILPDVMQ